MTKNHNYWETKPLSEMTDKEWESLCDGCGKCCLVQLQDEETEELLQTNIACWLFDDKQCQCRSYSERANLEPSCLIMDKNNIAESVKFAPSTCAYKLLYEGKPLLEWHPLISGEKGSVHRSGMSVKNKTIAMCDVGSEGLESYIIESFASSDDAIK